MWNFDADFEYYKVELLLVLNTVSPRWVVLHPTSNWELTDHENDARYRKQTSSQVRYSVMLGLDLSRECMSSNNSRLICSYLPCWHSPLSPFSVTGLSWVKSQAQDLQSCPCPLAGGASTPLDDAVISVSVSFILSNHKPNHYLYLSADNCWSSCRYKP